VLSPPPVQERKRSVRFEDEEKKKIESGSQDINDYKRPFANINYQPRKKWPNYEQKMPLLFTKFSRYSKFLSYLIHR